MTKDWRLNIDFRRSCAEGIRKELLRFAKWIFTSERDRVRLCQKSRDTSRSSSSRSDVQFTKCGITSVVNIFFSNAPPQSEDCFII